MKLRSLDLRNFKVHRRKLNLVISISTKVGIFGIMRAKSACKVNQIRTKYIELIIKNEFKIIFALILLYLGPCRTIQNTSKCTDGSCTTTATDEMTCSSGVTINTSSTNTNTNGRKKSRYIHRNIWHYFWPNNIDTYFFLGRYVSKHLTEFIHFDFNKVINDWALCTTIWAKVVVFFLQGQQQDQRSHQKTTHPRKSQASMVGTCLLVLHWTEQKNCVSHY